VKDNSLHVPVYLRFLIVTLTVIVISIFSINCASRSGEALIFFNMSMQEKIDKQMDGYGEAQVSIISSSKGYNNNRLTPEEESMRQANMKWLEDLGPILNAHKSFMDWDIREVSNEVYIVNGYGLGLTENNKPCVGKWYYHNFDRSIVPADAPGVMLDQFLSRY